MKKFRNLLVILFLTSISFANEIDSLLDILAEKNIITYGEAQILKTETKEQIKTLNAQGKNELLPKWIQNLSFKGDLRLRLQSDQKPNTNTAARNRARIRFRLGAETRMEDNLKAGFGLATTSLKSGSSSVSVSVSTKTGKGSITVPSSTVADGEPRSTNFTLGDSLSKMPIAVDYAYVEYDPADFIKVLGGKFKNPIWNATDLLWDSDLNPDGLALVMKLKPSENISLFFTPEVMIIDEISSSEKDPLMYAFQPGLDIKWQSFSLKSAVAYYIFSGVKGNKLDHSAGTNTRASTALSNNYTSVNPSVSISKSELPLIKTVSVFGDYVINTDSSTNNTGYSIGLQIGNSKISDLGQWSLKSMYRQLETDSWLDTFPDSDAYGGKTNCQGREMIFELGLSKNSLLSFDYYSMDKLVGNSSKTPNGTVLEVMQLDFVYKF